MTLLKKALNLVDESSKRELNEDEVKTLVFAYKKYAVDTREEESAQAYRIGKVLAYTKYKCV